MANAFTDDNFQDEVKNHTGVVLVDFFAEWCGPCKMQSPVIDELATEMEGKVKIGKVDVDVSPNTAQEFGVMSIPTLIFVKDGQEVKRLQGFNPKEKLVEELNELMT